jgi:glucose/arabinose dehydrogenase
MYQLRQNFYYFLQSSFGDTTGIIPNNDNNNLPFVFPTNSTPASQSPLPAPVIHNTRAPAAPGGPTLKDPNLKVEQILTGLKLPTSMAFLTSNDILVLEKNTGIIHRIVNGKCFQNQYFKFLLLQKPNEDR